MYRKTNSFFLFANGAYGIFRWNGKRFAVALFGLVCNSFARCCKEDNSANINSTERLLCYISIEQQNPHNNVESFVQYTAAHCREQGRISAVHTTDSYFDFPIRVCFHQRNRFGFCCSSRVAIRFRGSFLSKLQLLQLLVFREHQANIERRYFGGS